MAAFPTERIRNISIIAHIDHGKSTLADRLLELTGTIQKGASNKQVLDKLKVERERGITVKAQSCSMFYKYPKDGQTYLINLIDTPGHVDFSYEVSRSLSACEGALLLVDCTQGIQAQSISVFQIALENDLEVIPVVNKVDLPAASPEVTVNQIETVFGLDGSTAVMTSAKTGLNVDKVLEAVVENIPMPPGNREGDLKALLIDSEYNRYKGVINLVNVKDGQIKIGDKITSAHSGKSYEVLDCGIMNPGEVSTGSLMAGQVGYLITNMKNEQEAHVGDTFHRQGETVEPLPGFKSTTPMVFAGFFPIENSDYVKLEDSIRRLALNDRSVEVKKEASAALGQGCRLGFLGTLHMDVFRQRLEDEFESEVIVTAPSVPYIIKDQDGKSDLIENPADFPDRLPHGSKVFEPMVDATIVVPESFLGSVIDLCENRRGTQTDYRTIESVTGNKSNSDSAGAGSHAKGEQLGGNRAVLKYRLPLSEIVTDFYDSLKSITSGFASFDYEEAPYEEAPMRKLSLMVNKKVIDALVLIVHKSVESKVGKVWVNKLKEIIPRGTVEVRMQAMCEGKVVAAEMQGAFRKDVLKDGKIGGGDYQRKAKVLGKQKAGKERMKKTAGDISLPQGAFFAMLKK